VTIGIFEIHNIASVAMENQLKLLLNSFGLLDKVIAYVEDERSNWNTLTFALTFVVSCFGHAMSKATKYATKDNEVYVGFS
jgi:hypothetical protein